MPEETAQVLGTIGALLVASLGASWVGRRTRLPRVSLLLLIGVTAGPLVLDVLPDQQNDWFPIVSRIALVMVGFLIGGEFTASRLRRLGRDVGIITLVQGVATAGIVAAGLVVAGVDPVVALLLGGVATATDPAATRAVIEEEGAEGELPDRLLGVVALDDVVGIATFSVLLTAAGAVTDGGWGWGELTRGAWEIGGGIAVGVVLGLPAALLTGRIQPGEPTLEEALGLVFLCSGLTLWLDVSFLLAAVTLGAVVANGAAHHTRPFREVESIEWPFLTLFFVLAGAAVDQAALAAVGVAAGYVALRTAGKVTGAWAGARWVGAEPSTARWLGVGLLPQAGVALGMALAAAERFPELTGEVLAVAVLTTVLFELFGPLGVRAALTRA